ncbi:hypothetical protein PCE1_001354 [Barthelona sp. PCE]
MPSLSDQLFQMRFTSKQLLRSSKKAEKAAKAERKKVLKATERGNADVARIHAENSIRKKNESVQLLTLASRIDAVQSRLEYAHRTNQMSQTMNKVTKNLSSALKSMDLNRITATMGSFEQATEELDVAAAFMDETMVSTTATTTPQDAVDALIHEVAEEKDIVLDANLQILNPTLSNKGEVSEDDLESRLAQLRGE